MFDTGQRAINRQAGLDSQLTTRSTTSTTITGLYVKKKKCMKKTNKKHGRKRIQSKTTKLQLSVPFLRACLATVQVCCWDKSMKSERQYVGSSFHTSTLRVITLFQSLSSFMKICCYPISYFLILVKEAC